MTESGLDWKQRLIKFAEFREAWKSNKEATQVLCRTHGVNHVCEEG